jgi:hypothetical protein
MRVPGVQRTPHTCVFFFHIKDLGYLVLLYTIHRYQEDRLIMRLAGGKKSDLRAGSQNYC